MVAGDTDRGVHHVDRHAPVRGQLSAGRAQPATVCLHYDPASLVGAEQDLVLLHYDATANPPGWVDVTSSRDPAADTICGLSTLSPFAIAEGTPTGTQLPPRPAFALRQNVPNPFNPTTTVEYVLPERGSVSLQVFNVNGRLVRSLVEGTQDAGPHRVQWQGDNDDGKRCSSGVYFYRLETPNAVLTRRMVLVR